MNICETFNLEQVNHKTERNNTLDLFFTNDMELFTEIKGDKTSISDHRITEITTTYSLDTHEKQYGTEKDVACLSDLTFTMIKQTEKR